jgi:hypothetical protein
MAQCYAGDFVFFSSGPLQKGLDESTQDLHWYLQMLRLGVFESGYLERLAALDLDYGRREEHSGMDILINLPDVSFDGSQTCLAISFLIFEPGIGTLLRYTSLSRPSSFRLESALEMRPHSAVLMFFLQPHFLNWATY